MHTNATSSHDGFRDPDRSGPSIGSPSKIKLGRNLPCPCGSGKKFKHCHYDKPFSPGRDMSVHARNRTLLHAAEEIFGFNRGRQWQDFKRNISGKEVTQFYEVQAALWHPDTDWASIVPKPDGKLRGLYLGDIRPELILKNLVRFSLYSDELFVVDPFHNPWILRPEYNPLENPEQFKSDTIKLVYFLFQIAPWIESGVVQLVPDPGDFNLHLKQETWRLAKERLKGKELDQEDLADARAVGRKDLQRMIFSLPDDTLIHQVERSGQTLTDQQKKDFVSYARQQLRDDPLALEQPPANNYRNGQLTALRGGANLETALLISDITGAFPYTSLRTRWHELMSAREALSETARMWSPLAKAFQSLDFRFLNDVDVKFANSIREDGRLETFRSLLRKIGKGAAEVNSAGSLEAYVRDCKDELIGEHRKAEAEWSKIDESFVKWAGSGTAAAATSLISGHLVPDIAALSAATLHTIGQLWLRYFRRQQFKKSNPMSVFIDLSRREPPGVTLL
jgi:hypothetical protein